MLLLGVDSQGVGALASVHGIVLIIVLVDLCIPNDLKNCILQVGGFVRLGGLDG